jgi:hypothetical protein
VASDAPSAAATPALPNESTSAGRPGALGIRGGGPRRGNRHSRMGLRDSGPPASLRSSDTRAERVDKFRVVWGLPTCEQAFLRLSPPRRGATIARLRVPTLADPDASLRHGRLAPNAFDEDRRWLVGFRDVTIT